MNQILLDRFFERMVAFTLPRDRRMQVCTHDEIFEIDLGQRLVQVIDGDPSTFCDKHQTLGVYGQSQAIQKIEMCSLTYDFDPRQDYVIVKLRLGNDVEQVRFPILSGDWFEASFSDCGRYLILAEPYDLYIYDLRK